MYARNTKLFIGSNHNLCNFSQKGRLSLYTISNQTIFDENKIKQYGLIPLLHTESNGFGGYFVNETLKQVEVKRFPDGRYFQPKNTNEGVSIKIEFNIK